MSSLRRISSLACQRPPLPAVIVAAGSHPLPVSVPLPAIIVALVPCPSASPCLTTLSRRLSFLACQRPPTPAVVVTASSCPLPVSVPLPAIVVALVPCLSASPCLPSSSPPALVPCQSASPCLPSLSRRLSSLARQHPPLPAVVIADDAPALAVPPPPSPCCQPPLSSAATIIIATKPSLPLPPPPISCILGKVPFHIQSN